MTTGGTGFSPRDVTLEAVGPLLDQPIEGFGELFRMLSYQQVGAAAMLSRAAAGLVGDRAVFLLPGSPKAVTLAMEELILPEAGAPAGAGAPARPWRPSFHLSTFFAPLIIRQRISSTIEPRTAMKKLRRSKPEMPPKPSRVAR